MSLHRERDRITSVGLHVVYEPRDGEDTLLDVILIHGFGGHPARSWQYEHPPVLKRTTSDPSTHNSSLKERFEKSAESLLSQVRKGTPLSVTSISFAESEPPTAVFWPRDILPPLCPSARVVTWGYHVARRDDALVQSQPDIFAHADELVKDLVRFRNDGDANQRPLAFVAQSIGGVIVKEMLRQADASEEPTLRDILASTAATVFLGWPHRGIEETVSPNIVLSMAKASLGADVDELTLSSLCGVEDLRWRLGQEAFVKIWHNFNFIVKTYCEAPSVSTDREVNTLTDSRVQSSQIDDPRENAERLPVSHGMMGRFRSADDDGFESLLKIVRRVAKDEKKKQRWLSASEQRCFRELSNLLDSGWDHTRMHPSKSTTRACKRLMGSIEFNHWYRRRDGVENRVLWLTGSAGSGKSTLLRHIETRIERQWKRTTTPVVYCTTEGRCFDRVVVSGSKLSNARSTTVIRCILAQLLSHDPTLRTRLCSYLDGTCDSSRLARFFLDVYVENRIELLARRAFVLVDAEDCCEEAHIRDMLYCFSRMARNSDISIIMTSRHVIDVLPNQVTRLNIENYNYDDVELLVRARLRANWEERLVLVKKIGGKARGNFLWAELTTTLLNELIEGGAAQDLVDQVVEELPTELDDLYDWILGTLSAKEKIDATILMRWVMLACEPMTLNDLRMAVRLTHPDSLRCSNPTTALSVGSPCSVQELQRTGKQFDTPAQFYRWMRSRTYGLLETKPTLQSGNTQQSLGLRHIQPVHDSVKSFFLSGRGFAALSVDREAGAMCESTPTDEGHYSLIRTILEYLNTLDLSPLVSGQTQPQSGPSHLSRAKSPSWRQTVTDQRKLIMSSYPFLRYAVDNLLYHVLAPRAMRYFLPQQALFGALYANDCRIWRRWTALQGETGPVVILSRCPSAEDFLRPECGAVYRLERVFRALSKIVSGESWLSPRQPKPLDWLELQIDELKDMMQIPKDEGHFPGRLAKRGPRSRGTMVVSRKARPACSKH
ncbi:hypothetical protein F5Y18DRAFT_436909 [Xylariaceae sp. FL1019]|nr:hypothetical protein F5Y18DRAFT_436909 [Xylariaceae sp. FL1019]